MNFASRTTNSLTSAPCFCVCMFGITKGSVSDPALPSPHQHTLSSIHGGQEQYPPTTTGWQCSTSYNYSDATEPKAASRSGVAAQQNVTSWSNQGHTDSFGEIRGEAREPLNEDSDDSDTVFSEQPSVLSQRVNERLSMSPLRRQASLHHSHEIEHRSLCSRSSLTDELHVWEELGEDDYENGHQDKRRPWVFDQGRNYRDVYGGLHRSRDSERDCRSGEVRERRSSRSASVRLHDRSRQSSRDLARTWSCKEDSDKHVRFQEDTRSSDRQQDQSGGIWEMLGQVLRERGVPVRIGSNGASLQIGPQSRDSQVLHGSEVSCSDSRPHQRGFQRASTTRHSFHGDIREKRRLSYRESSGRDHREAGDRHRNIVEHDGEVYEISRRDSYLSNRERGSSARWRERGCTNTQMKDRNVNDCRVTTRSEQRHWHKPIGERLSSEEEQEVERRRGQPHRRAPQRSQSLSSSRPSTRDRSRHVAAGNTQNCSQLQSAEGNLPKLCSLTLSLLLLSSLNHHLIWTNLAFGGGWRGTFSCSCLIPVALRSSAFILIFTLLSCSLDIVTEMNLVLSKHPMLHPFSSWCDSVLRQPLLQCSYSTLCDYFGNDSSTPRPQERHCNQRRAKPGWTWGSCSRSYRMKSWLGSCSRKRKSCWGG